MTATQDLERDGFVILENVLDASQVATLRGEATRLLGPTGRNDFEGEKTQRVYSVIAKTLAMNPLVEHPQVLPLLEASLRPGALLSQLQVINILPGETVQPLHHDDAFYLMPRPRPALGVATIWAIDDFTEENGATLVIPGSHEWGSERVPRAEDERVPIVMSAGSVVFFVGTLWHGGGANQSDAPRLAVTAQYCEPYLRTQENYSLSTPRDVVAQCSERVQRMLGYAIYGPFMGMVDGRHPKRLLGES